MRFWLLALLILVLVGCSDDNREVATPPADAPLQEKPVRNRVVITANGREFWQTNLNERIELMVKVATIANPNMKLSDIARLRKRLR